MWRNKRVLVTGAGGFIGSHLVEKLVSLGARVRALVRHNSRNDLGCLELIESDIKRELDVIVGDVTDSHSITRAVEDCAVVFHLAALIAVPYSYAAPAQYVAVNCGGTLNVLEASLALGVERLVHTSTSEVYGTAQYIPIDENHRLKAQSPYAATKIAAERLVESYNISFGLPAVIIRPFNTYGPRQSVSSAIPTIIMQSINAKALFLGSLEPRRDLNYISDIVDGLIKAATTDQAIGQVINLGTGRSVSIGELAKVIVKQLGIKKNIAISSERLKPKANEVWHLECDNRLAQEMLGWQPQVSLEEGLQRTIDSLTTDLANNKFAYNI